MMHDPQISAEKDSGDIRSALASGQQDILRITWIGLVINLFLSAFKFAAGIIGASAAVKADAIHSLTDTVTDLVVIIGSYFWSRPPDSDHQHGHHRIESVVTLFIGAALFALGVTIGWDAVRALQRIDEISPSPPGWIAAAAAALSIIIKEVLYRWTFAAGRRVKSPALIANAWHHRSDALSSIPILAAVTGAIFFPAWAFLDHAGAALVSVFIMQAALMIIWPAVREFMDLAAPEELCRKIRAICLTHPQVVNVHRIRTRYIGLNIQCDLHILVSGEMTVSDGHHIAGDVKNQIFSQIPDVIDVLIHVEPAGEVQPDAKC
jgi:cation diffusion facilitator family transporter